MFHPWPHSAGQGSRVALSCGVGHRWGSDPMLLWLWPRPAGATPIQPLAWELPYAKDVALERKKKKGRKEEKGSSHSGSAVRNPTNTHEDVG